MDDWKPGDLALCVNAGIVRDHIGLACGGGLRRGRVYIVLRVFVCPEFGDHCLILEGDNDEGFGRLSHRFRKINPLNEAEHAAAMRELNTPVREPVQ